MAKPKTFLRFVLALTAMVFAFALSRDAHADRIRDLADVAGARENQLVGYGIVTGLNGTGDDTSVPFTSQSVLSLLRRLNVQVDPAQIRLRNVAAVIVTANMPPFAKQGSKLDITVASVGNAKSLSGGILVQTLLKGADQKTYAAAQGAIVIGGFDAKGSSGSSVSKGSTTVGRIMEGALIEREIPTNVVEGDSLKLELRTPGFGTASRMAEAINKRFGDSASAQDGGAIRVKIPAEFQKKIVELIAQLEEIEVTPVRRARVVLNERTGTIVAGGDVRLSPAVVVHGALTIVVKETPTVSQPNAPFGKGTTAVVARSELEAHEGQNPIRLLPQAPTLADVASALGSLGLSPRDLGSVLSALRAAGALEAEVVIQ